MRQTTKQVKYETNQITNITEIILTWPKQISIRKRNYSLAENQSFAPT